MPSWIELRLGCHGLLRLARFNRDFPRFFDRSASGALRSFWLAVPIYPFFILQLSNTEAMNRTPDTAQFMLAMSVGYVMMWIVPPLLLAWLAPLAGRDAEMPGCITVYNWLSVLNVGIALPLLAIELAGVAPEAMTIPHNLLLLLSLAWEAFLLAHALRIVLWQAALVAVADHLILYWILLPIFLVLGGVPASSG
jgi:hypothetical protein